MTMNDLHCYVTRTTTTVAGVWELYRAARLLQADPEIRAAGIWKDRQGESVFADPPGVLVSIQSIEDESAEWIEATVDGERLEIRPDKHARFYVRLDFTGNERGY
jgi:hypothetical protein